MPGGLCRTALSRSFASSTRTASRLSASTSYSTACLHKTVTFTSSSASREFRASFTNFTGRVLPSLIRPPSSVTGRSLTTQTHLAPSIYVPSALSHSLSRSKASPDQRRASSSASSSATTMSSTSEQRLNKRKQAPSNSSPDRPMKQFKQAGAYQNGDENGGYSPELVRGDSNISEMPLDVEEGGRLSRVPTTAVDTAEWQATVEKVIKNVVSIHFCQTHSFDTDGAVASEATGFVVDAEKGYILTNRHVVGAGPFWGYCIFDNHEECDVYPVYRDPVHDFGILRFDPKKIKYMPVTALKLRPDLAKVGSEIRVVGNDAGEKLSILSGVISRLDRNAPEYGDGYCDFNTNYIQAAASASGGSSGSPVVNQDGHAVALQAGGRSDGAATDYFLPLDRPLRALQLIQEGKSISRGTIQTQWLLKPYDECRRLGLTANWEAEMRAQFPNETGVLVAEVVLPNGPAHEKLEEGDVLLKVNGELVSQFIKLDDIFDSSVSSSVKLLIQRGGEDIEVEITIGDLHAITPDRFVQVAGATFHDLSYQQARLYAISITGNGVYVCETGGTFRLEGSESGWMIQSVNNEETPDLDTFIKVMTDIPDRSRVVIAYKHLRDLHTRNTAIINVDRHWHKKMRLAVRNDKTGMWDFSDLSDPKPALPRTPQKAKFITMSNEKHPQVVEIIKSFVRVTCLLPVKLDGFPRGRKTGYGLVVDASKGLVVISRAVVPYDMCDIHITIADSIQVPGKVLFMHPLQNFAVLQYDASLVHADVQSAKLSKDYVKQGQEIVFFGFNQNYRPVTVSTTITDITTVAIPATSVTPRYRAVNIDAITVDTNLAAQCGSGVLMNEDGTVLALWMTYLGDRSGHSGKDVEYHLGLQTPIIQPVIDQIAAGVVPDLRIMNAELHTCPMDHARILGVPEEWISRVETEDPERHQLFMVRTVDSDSNGAGLQETDVLLTLNGKLITRVSDLDIQYDNETLDAVIIRKRSIMSLQVATTATSNIETSRIAVFCGALLHRPHHAVRQQISKIHSDVYISGRTRGSPAYMYGLAPTNFITHLNGVSTPDLPTFLKEAEKIPDNTYFRLKVITFDNVPWVATMKKNEHYFPTVEMIKDPGEELGWKVVVREGDKSGEQGVSSAVDVEAAVSVGSEIPEGSLRARL